MCITPVNRYLAFKYITDKEKTFCEFTNVVGLAICAKAVEGEGGAVAAAKCGVWYASAAAEAALEAIGGLPG